MPGHRGLVLVVDQFEQALAGDAQLIDRLLEMAGPRVSVVVALVFVMSSTLRRDQEGSVPNTRRIDLAAAPTACERRAQLR